ncbi:hypothetical protein B7463_g8335, partial [Scytalidium lignicola]
MDSSKRKRGRPSNSSIANTDRTPSQEAPPSKRVRSSQAGPADTINQGALGRGGMRRSLENSIRKEVLDKTTSQGSADPSKRKKALSNADINVQSRPPSSKAVKGKSNKPDKNPNSSHSSQGASQPKRQSQQSTRQVSEESEEPETSRNYPRLVPITRRIPRDKIDAQWEPLQNNCIERISQLLQDVERPVIMRVRDEDKRIQARTAIQMVSRKLISKLSKGLPFPPGIRSQRVEDFDFEKVLDNNRSLEAQLNPILHSNELLAAELAHETELLESEREVMGELERNAKLATTKRKESQKKLHSLLQLEDDSVSKEEKMDLGSRFADITKHPTFNFDEDEDYTAIMQEVTGHVESIRGNLNQVQGIGQAMAKGNAAVQATLFDHLGEEHTRMKRLEIPKLIFSTASALEHGGVLYDHERNDLMTNEPASDVMEQNGATNGQDVKPQASPPNAAAAKSPKKRRKVNHGKARDTSSFQSACHIIVLIRKRVAAACVYCRRSHMTCDLERPCARCIKRNIGHLCHDEPREQDSSAAKKAKSQHSNSAEEDGTSPSGIQSSTDAGMRNSFDQSQEQVQDGGLGIGPTTLSQSGPLQLVQPSPVSGIPPNALTNNNNQFLGYSNDWIGSQNQFQDIHHYHPSYMFNTPEVTNEYNLLNDFLNNSLLDDGALLPDDTSNFFADQQGPMLSGSLNNGAVAGGVHPGGSLVPPGNQHGNQISRPSSVLPTDKTREYYLQAADPTGNDAPEERMQRLLRAKYDAGLLKPFNYVKGYARLSAYMDSHMHSAAKMKILRQLDRFRPKFREKVQTLTDIELVYVEMWFERSLMEYDRVFASMAVPACCWRRTGEIFRGNKEMAELIHVPIEKLRDGKIALHEILTEESLVNYWEKFGAIAFDQTQKALLTSCSLKNPDDQSKDPTIKCCFSFTIRRDIHKIPCLIVGNFLPQDPVKRQT